ncbi:MAG: carbon-nitrogen family hydrolase [Leptospira sp.]|nr:carbon-nitrogen family hydrolase [Leptospira sp.]
MDSDNFIKISIVQPDIVWENPESNFTHFTGLINGCDENPDLVILPETCSTGFTMKSKDFAEERNGKSENFFLGLANARKSYIGGGWIEKNPDGLPFNTFSIASPSGEIIARYRKIHPFSPGKEDQHFSAGKEIVRFKIKNFTITPFICYDLRFPEVFRKASGETDIFIVVGNWPAERIQTWVTLLKARSIENVAYAIGVNRVGLAGRKNPIDHNGYSGFFYPDGKSQILDSGKEETLSSEISKIWLDKFRETHPYLKDRKF